MSRDLKSVARGTASRIRFHAFLLVFGLGSLPARAQDLPFLFSLNADHDVDSHLVVQWETGLGRQPLDFTSDDERSQQRLGLHATFGKGWTLDARMGREADSEREADLPVIRSYQQVELLHTVARVASAGLTVAAGMGIHHEIGGTDAILWRVVAGRSVGTSQLVGNLVIEKPLSSARDSMDIVTTIGWSHHVTAAVSLGVEAVGEDLEGFWDPNEKEGGAKLLV